MRAPIARPGSIETHAGSAQDELFLDSLPVLAQLALRQTGARGYAFFRKIPLTGALVTRYAEGVAIPEAALTGDGLPAVVAYPLRVRGLVNGILAFAFPDQSRRNESHPQLDRIAATIGAIWDTAGAPDCYAQLISRVSELETRILDSKIADRARGLLEHGADPQVPEVLARHVTSLLRPSPIRRTLVQILGALEEEVEERRLAAQAKAVLQATRGISEAQAYAQLRLMSRKSRRRLKDVARELIDQQNVEGRT